MNATAARSLINTQGRNHTLVVYFTKRNGERRRMVARYDGSLSRKPYLITLWDLEKGAYRSVDLDTVEQIVVCRPGRGHKPRTFADVKAGVDQLFY